MPNPFFQNRTSPNSATTPENPINESNKNYRVGYNRFNFGRSFYNTLRYADITPHEVLEAWSGDKLPIGCRHEIRTHTLASPLMSGITMKKSYFAIDYRSFLPNNWDKILVNPKHGDDINADLANTVIYNLPSFLSELRSNIINYFDGEEPNFTFALPCFLLFESFLSNGSLLSSLGFHTGNLVSAGNSDTDFDTIVDECFSDDPELLGDYNTSGYFGVGFMIDGILYGKGPRNGRYWTWRQIIDYARSHPEAILYQEGFDFGKMLLDRFFTKFTIVTPQDPSFRLPLNYSRCLAYQLACAQFYTNDNVDSVYNRDLWIQSQQYCLDRYNASPGYPPSELPVISDKFDYNGIRCHYDVVSGNNVNKALEILCTNSNLDFYFDIVYSETHPFYFLFNFIYNIFSYRQSLRYGDYFTGSRTRVLAVGDVDTPVVSSSVNALDLTRNLMLQRFLNQVNRVGSRIVDYVRDVLGGVSAPDVEIPRFLASVSSNVSGFEVENTAQNQGDIVTLLKSSDSNYIYEVEVGEPCIIIGLTTFSIPRVYSRTADRFFFHVDRFDMFNPFMQYTGDQQIYNGERDSSTGNRPFAYTGRHMEYKQRYPIASGGFISKLKGWLFITDNYQAASSSYLNNTQQIDENYIHSQNTEMDRFYSSLTGVSLASYFHFIVAYHNSCDALRKMDYSPSIL